MIWKKAQTCVVCKGKTRQGEKIYGQFMCTLCEKEMVDELATEQEKSEFAELDRVSNGRNVDGYRIA